MKISAVRSPGRPNDPGSPAASGGGVRACGCDLPTGLTRSPAPLSQGQGIFGATVGAGGLELH